MGSSARKKKDKKKDFQVLIYLNTGLGANVDFS